MKLPADSVDRILSAFETVELGDPRRSERLTHTLRKLAGSPEATIPEAMGSDAELEGAYRLLRNPRVTLEKLTLAHAEATAKRARAAGAVLVIHDTTTCEFAHAAAAEVGYLSTGKAGFMAHYSLAVTADECRQPLGVADISTIFRSRPPKKRSGRKAKRRSGFETRKNPERESLRWLRGFDSAAQRLGCNDVVHVADREGDSYDIFTGAIKKGHRFVIRARVTGRRARLRDGTEGTIQTLAEACEGILTREVTLSTRTKRPEPASAKVHPPRATRKATLSFSAATVTLPKPRYMPSTTKSVTINMVRVYEDHAPKGQPAVEWILFTTEPIATVADIAKIVDIYRARWLIEECNKALKTGCKYEQRQLESRQSLLNLLAMTLPIACELLWLRSCARSTPDLPAGRVLAPVQLQILRALSSYQLPRRPTVRDALLAVAALGGHIRSNGDPGWLVLHRGLTKLLAYEQGWLARENAGGLSISR
jgi:hypothetical protein